MSATAELPGGRPPVHRVAPAVLVPPHPSDEELAFDWTLSERDGVYPHQPSWS